MNTSGNKIGRRDFLKRAGLATPLLFSAQPSLFAGSPGGAMATSGKTSRRRTAELAADLVIIGGGLGGCAAALAAARNGLRVIMTEETDWIGGQLTQQAVPPDENRWIESFGCTRSYQALRTGIREYYLRNYPLTQTAKASKQLNPGNCWVSRIGCEPRAGLAVLHEMLAPYLGNGWVRILLRHKAVNADNHGDRVEAVQVVSLDS